MKNTTQAARSRILILSLLSLSLIPLWSCTSTATRKTASDETVTAVSEDDQLPEFSDDEMKVLLKRSHVMESPAQNRDVAAKDILKGPAKGAFGRDETVECTYAKTERVHPKINCTLANGDEIAVKFDTTEIPGEIFASRLLWSLGFPADRYYPVAKVRCLKCPAKPKYSHENIVDEVILDYAVIERKYPGKKIKTHRFPEGGWSFEDLDLLDGTDGGATRAESDALKLLMVFLQHWDNKSLNNRFTCPKGGIKRDEEGKMTCDHPMLVVQDLGSTLGKGGVSNKLPNLSGLGIKGIDAMRSSRVKFADWKHQKIWRNANDCHADLIPYMNGKLKHPRIGEAGRKLLIDLMDQLTPQQKRDLFTIAGVQKPQPNVTIDQWVEVFDRKLAEIRNKTCP